MRLLARVSILLASSLSLSATTLNILSNSSVVIIPPTVSNGPTRAEYMSSAHGLDGFKLSNINSTAFGELWFFDAVSDDGRYWVVASFWASPSPSLTMQLRNEKILSVQMVVRVDDDIYSANSVFAEAAQIFTHGKGMNGTWKGTGSSFSGSEDLSTYSINFSSPFEITGSILMEPVAPAHYKCSSDEVGIDTQILPELGWANPIPDAQATVALKVNGTDVKFKGIGYHDLTWSNTPLFRSGTDSVFREYNWGHGRIGPYSIVWLVIAGSDGTNLTSGYVSKDGIILGTPCSDVSVTLRFNPSTEQIQGSSVRMGLGDKGTIHAELEVEKIVINDAGVISGSGRLRGVLGDEGSKHAGVASFTYYNSVH
ncbi:hypothetical protein J3R30DRAFT_3278233 [Lentinula aciculospora]|uniref:Uncharacterized protein n=1 Tax=Lentinula aciculospora TaxID=153920 RepID=A0A9W9AT72_9AGAR|nr:hypothetical protein J3R30DRAFT_3278233 [Lentinula aciculospora]